MENTEVEEIDQMKKATEEDPGLITSIVKNSKKEYLKKILESSEINQSAKEMSDFLVQTSLSKMTTLIDQNNIQIAHEKKNLSLISPKHKFEKIEKNCMQKKLKDAGKFKQELQEKLKAVSMNIEILKFQENSLLIDKKEIFSSQKEKANKINPKNNENFIEIIKERKHLEKKRQERIIKELEKIKDEEGKAKDDEIRLKEEDIKKRRSDAEKNVQKIKEREHKRKEDGKESEKVIKSLKEQPTLADKIVSNYQKEYVMTSLESKKQELARIRDLHRPITKDILEEHKKNCEEMNNKKDEERKRRIQEFKDYSKETYKKIHHESIFLERVKYQDQQRWERDNYRKSYQEKIKNFSRKIKEEYKPLADPKKAKEFEDLKKTINDKKSRRKDLSLDILPNKIGNEYLASVKEKARKYMEKKDKCMSENHEITANNDEAFSTVKTELTPMQKRNYIRDLYGKIGIQSVKSKSEYEKILFNANISEMEKEKLIKIEAEKNEEKAKWKELLMKHKKDDTNIEEESENVASIYVNAIKAKLAIINELKNE